ncbi:MAG: NAD(+)/NADH kinase [Chloroflexota bacterium]
MDKIGLLYHPSVATAQPLAEEIGEWLAERNIRSWAAPTDADNAVKAELAASSLLVVLGGDGSMLKAAHLLLDCDIPLFGVNLGRVGFLSEAQVSDWPQKLARVLDGDFWTERRLMIQADLWRNGRLHRSFAALNDIVVGRGQQARVLRLHLYVDGDLVTIYTADALIVATPTGSTAYSMAAGGPLLPPQLQNFVVVPVAAHLSLDRAMVLHEEAEIDIHVQMDHEAMLTADGQSGIQLLDGDRITLKKHPHVSLFARVDSSGYFYRRLMRRLGFYTKAISEE